MNAAQHVIWARNTLEESGTTARPKWSDQELLRLVNRGAAMAQRATHYVEAHSTFSTVANQREYDLPPDVHIPKKDGVILNVGTTQLTLGFTPFDAFIRDLPQVGTPWRYTLYEKQRKVLLGSTPSAAAATTTLTSAIAVTDMTVSGTDFSSFPATAGRMAVDTGVSLEVMEYVSMNAAKTQVTLGARALEGTNRVAHANGLTVTLRDVHVYGAARLAAFSMPRLYKVGRATFTRDDETVAGTGTPAPAWTTEVWSRDEIGFTPDLELVDPVTWMTVDYVANNTSLETLTRWPRTTATAVPYIVCSPNPLGDQFDDVIQAYLMLGTAYKDGDAKMVTAMTDKIAGELGIAKGDVWGEARPLTVQGFYDGPVNEASFPAHGMRVDWT